MDDARSEHHMKRYTTIRSTKHHFCMDWLVYTLNIACMRLHGVPQNRGTTIYIHTLLDEAEGAVCVGRHDPFMKNLLNIRLISLNLNYCCTRLICVLCIDDLCYIILKLWWNPSSLHERLISWNAGSIRWPVPAPVSADEYEIKFVS